MLEMTKRAFFHRLFGMLRRLIPVAFFQTKSKKWGETNGEGRQQPWRRKSGRGAEAQGAHGEDQRGEDGGGHDGACRAGGHGCSAREGFPQIPAEERAGVSGGGSVQRNIRLAESKGL